jgi:hypothetical protein
MVGVEHGVASIQKPFTRAGCCRKFARCCRSNSTSNDRPSVLRVPRPMISRRARKSSSIRSHAYSRRDGLIYRIEIASAQRPVDGPELQPNEGFRAGDPDAAVLRVAICASISAVIGSRKDDSATISRSAQFPRCRACPVKVQSRAEIHSTIGLTPAAQLDAPFDARSRAPRDLPVRI